MRWNNRHIQHLCVIQPCAAEAVLLLQRYSVQTRAASEASVGFQNKNSSAVKLPSCTGVGVLFQVQVNKDIQARMSGLSKRSMS